MEQIFFDESDQDYYLNLRQRLMDLATEFAAGYKEALHHDSADAKDMIVSLLEKCLRLDIEQEKEYEKIAEKVEIEFCGDGTFRAVFPENIDKDNFTKKELEKILNLKKLTND